MEDGDLGWQIDCYDRDSGRRSVLVEAPRTPGACVPEKDFSPHQQKKAFTIGFLCRYEQ